MGRSIMVLAPLRRRAGLFVNAKLLHDTLRDCGIMLHVFVTGKLLLPFEFECSG